MRQLRMQARFLYALRSSCYVLLLCAWAIGGLGVLLSIVVFEGPKLGRERSLQ